MKVKEQSTLPPEWRDFCNYVLKKICLLLIVQLLDRKSTRLNSSHVAISYAVFCLKKKRRNCTTRNNRRDRRTRVPRNTHSPIPPAPTPQHGNARARATPTGTPRTRTSLVRTNEPK